MNNGNNSLVQVDSDVVSQGDKLLEVTSKTLPFYYREVRNWWNSLNEDWKLEFIVHWIDEEGIPDELLKQGKAFNRKCQIHGVTEWEIIVDEKGNIQRDPTDNELDRIMLIRHLSISEGFQDLKPLYILQHLQELGGNMNRTLKELTGIENIISLKEIDLRWSQISNLEPLRVLYNLERLNLYNSNIENLEPLADLNNLCSLNIGNAFNIKDLSPLIGLTNLSELNCSSISDIEVYFSPLSNLVSLKKLVCELNYIADFTFCKNFISLEYLNFRESHIFNPDTNPLSGLQNIRRLILSGTNIKDIYPLSDLNQLEMVWIDRTNVPESQTISVSKKIPKCNFVIEDRSFIDGTSIFYSNGIKKQEVLRIK